MNTTRALAAHLSAPDIFQQFAFFCLTAKAPRKHDLPKQQQHENSPSRRNSRIALQAALPSWLQFAGGNRCDYTHRGGTGNDLTLTVQ